jgi:hypothetical protein
MSELCLHIFCRVCLLRALEVSSACPNDRLPLGPHQVQPAPRIVSQMCDELIVRCPHHNLGCPYTGQRQSLGRHLSHECVYVETGCCSRECGETVRKIDLGKHMETCNYRMVDCDMCHTSIRFLDVEVSLALLPITPGTPCSPTRTQTHQASCPSSTVTCSYCPETLTRSSLAGHLLTCPNQPVPCPHSRFGCDWTGPRRLVDEEHLITCTYESLKGFLGLFESRMTRSENDNQRLRRRVDQLERDHEAAARELHACQLSLGPYYIPSSADNLPSSSLDLLRPQTSDLQDSPSLQELSDAFGDQLSLNPDHRPSSSFAAAQPDLVSFPPPSSSASAHYHPHHRSDDAAASGNDVLERLRHSLDAAEARLALDRGIHAAVSSDDEPPPSLFSVVSSIRTSIVTLAQSMENLQLRHDVNVMNETLHLQEEVQSLRAAVHGMRMQFSGHLMRCRFDPSSSFDQPPHPPSRSSGTTTGGHTWNDRDQPDDPTDPSSSTSPSSGARLRYPPMPGMSYLPTAPPYPRLRFSNQETKL